jgi:uncharacterized ferritin-like protein (DUF455 family)
MNFYTECYRALISLDVETKSKIIDDLIAQVEAGETVPEGFVPIVFTEPSYATIAQVVLPRALPRRKDFGTREGLATLVHSITHIERSAIDLALDAVYRFPQMPREYRLDWLIVAQDEVRHFQMLHGVLERLGHRYGDWPVHNGLFEMSMKTAGDILDRMAIIPRYFEAGGLDVNPQIAHKLQSHRGSKNVTEVIEALAVIEAEEIDHVRKGDRWFRRLCDAQGLDVPVTFLAILDRYNLRSRQRPHMNISARKEAGFACEELLALGAVSCD